MTVSDLIFQTAKSVGVDPQLAYEVANQESRLNQNAVSSAGAIGVFQLLPSTAASLGVDPYDLQQNIFGGITYLQQQLSAFGDPALALAAYNAGPRTVQNLVSKYGGDWLAHAPAETQDYVTTILGNLQTSWQSSLDPASITSALVSAPAAAAFYTPPQGGGVPAQSSSPLLWLALALMGIYLLLD